MNALAFLLGKKKKRIDFAERLIDLLFQLTATHSLAQKVTLLINVVEAISNQRNVSYEEVCI